MLASKTPAQPPVEEKEGVTNALSFDVDHFRVDMQVTEIALEITAKNTKSKRLFVETFDKEALEEMKLHQPVQEVAQLIMAAQNPTVESVELQVGYDASDSPNPKSLRSQHKLGDSLCLLVKIMQLWNKSTFAFKLVEEEREEVEILHDVTDDLRNEIEALRKEIKDLRAEKESEAKEHEKGIADVRALVEQVQQVKRLEKLAIAQWASTATKDDMPRWNVDVISPTLNGMISGKQDNETKLAIGLAGLYRITFRFSSDDNSGSNRYGYIYFKNNIVARTYHKGGNAAGCIVHLMNCNPGDVIHCLIQGRANADEKDVALIIERLGGRV